VFIAFTAEESGLIGSAYYCKKPVFPIDTTTTMINMDMVGRLQDDKLLVGGLGSSKSFKQLVEKLNEKHRFNLSQETSGQGPSDHSSFNNVKVPVIQFFTGFHEQYHRPTDRVETISVTGLRRIADMVTDVIAEVGTVRERPEFVKTGGFNRNTTLWSGSPSTGILPNYADTKPGVLLEGVVNNTAAAKAGLKKGDRLVALKGEPVKDATGFLAQARRLKAGEKVDLTIERDGKPQTVQLALTRASAGFPDQRFGFVADITDIKDGVLLTDVPANSAAAKAGLQKGDRLVAIAGETVQDAMAYMTQLRALQPGETVQFTVARGGKQLQVSMQVQAATASQRGQGGPGGRGGRSPATRFGAIPDFRGDGGNGVVLSRVQEDTPAAEAGLKAGDRIIAINGQPVEDVRAFVQAMSNLGEGAKIEVAIRRGDKEQKVQVVLK
jgi:S1-C subfamily serine protease